MGCRGVHFAITDAVRDQLLAAEDDDELCEIVAEIEEAWDRPHLCETDKAWDGIHRTLTDGTLLTEEEGEADPLSLAVLGGRTLNDGDDYFVVLVEASDVPRVAEALGRLTIDDIRARYLGTPFPDYQYGEKDEEDFAYTWGHLESLSEFFSNASRSGRHVIFTVSQ